MIKKTITYTDFDGNSRTEEHYFNLTKAEILDIQFEEVGGFDKMLTKIVQEQDVVKLIKLFKQIIKVSYGVKSPDGRKFSKSEDIWKNFVETEAYSQLYMELIQDSKKAADFINGILPAELNDPKAIEEAKKKLGMAEVAAE